MEVQGKRKVAQKKEQNGDNYTTDLQLNKENVKE